ncbi:terpene cyclase/mutase family protein [Mycoplasmatota bacterium]|nr:terpene cyclase/mutase family protein [Mycoplasmatota bacterium]
MKRLVLLLIAIVLIGGMGFPSANSAFAKERDFDLEEVIEDLINWKKSDVGATNEENLINSTYLQFAGTTPGDWYPIGLGRYNYSDDYNAYLAVITDKINERYQTPYKLHKAKATEWHRISLAVTAMGGNPTAIGEYNGNPIDLIADGTYNRGGTASPGRQGINGWIWSLIALDSSRYEVPEDAYHTRQDFIVEILKTQLVDGGFALSGKVSDPDITAMAMQALAPYYNSEIVFSYTSSKIKDDNNQYITMEKSVKQVIDECIALLSSVQTDDGDFSSWGMQNVESTDQVLVALCSLGINPETDPRFIKNGNTLIDGIMKYRLDNGGFLHSFTYDPDNPSSKPDEANTMASEQTLYSLVSLYRFSNNMRTLYDMRTEFTTDERQVLDNTINSINNLNDTSTKSEVEDALQLYYSVPTLDRSYISNYWILSKYTKKYNLKLPNEKLNYSGNNSGEEDIILYFTESNKIATNNLPKSEDLTTKYYVEVVNLRYILEHSEAFEGKETYKIKLDMTYNEILAIQAEIDRINEEIQDKLHPFDNIGLKDKETINELVNRYNALSNYDKTKITHYEDLLKSKTQVDNLTTALYIGSVLGIVAISLSVYIVLNIRHRKKKRLEKFMPESEE